MSAPDDIDPGRLNVEPSHKRRRKRRDRPDPPASLKASEPAAKARANKRPLSPGVMLEPRPDGRDGWQITSPHNDLNLWELQIADAFGTRSFSAMRIFMRDLKRLARLDWDESAQTWKANERELNAALAMVADIQPRNTSEAALAAQMVAVHWMQMRLSAEALNRGGMILDKEAALAGKLARTYTMQLEAMRALRGGKKPTRQTIIVKKESNHHVHYHTHRGVGETSGQSHEPPAAIAGQCQALPSPDTRGEVVPLPRRKGQG
jgi:hypothetical protein